MIQAYFTSRQKNCQVNGFQSKGKLISRGVPQGSVLGSLLFFIFINDLPCSLKCSEARMFADDTNITVTAFCFRFREYELERIGAMTYCQQIKSKRS